MNLIYLQCGRIWFLYSNIVLLWIHSDILNLVKYWYFWQCYALKAYQTSHGVIGVWRWFCSVHHRTEEKVLAISFALKRKHATYNVCATNSVFIEELTYQNKSTSQSSRLASTIKPGESEMTCLFRAIKCLTSSWPVIYLISLPVHLSHDFCQTPHQHADSISCLSSYVKVNNECLWKLSGAFECGQLV